MTEQLNESTFSWYILGTKTPKTWKWKSTKSPKYGDMREVCSTKTDQTIDWDYFHPIYIEDKES